MASSLPVPGKFIATRLTCVFLVPGGTDPAKRERAAQAALEAILEATTGWEYTYDGVVSVMRMRS